MPASPPDDAPILTIRGATKRFGRVVACDHVSLEVRAGEIRGLLGQNGAGKTTLMRVAAGLVEPDAGEVSVDGHVVPPSDPAAAAEAGLGMVHQHFSLVGRLTVWENVTLGERGRMDRRATTDRLVSIAERYGLAVDPDARVDALSPGERQRVEIIKCLRRDPRVIVLDEPTSVLTQHEARRLFDVLVSLVKDEGRAVVLISHRLEEILAATDRVTVLRDGRLVTTLDTTDADAHLLAAEMLGRDVSLRREGAAVGLTAAATLAQPTGAPEPRHDGAPVLDIDGLELRSRDGHRVLDGLSLQVRVGEIVGIAGVEGNGQGPLEDVLAGLVRPDGGEVRVHGRPVRRGRRDDHAIAVIPADRRGSGCVLAMSVAENLVLERPEMVMPRGVLSRRRLIARAERLVRDFGIVTPSVHAPLWSLSGGNQQRVVLARELSEHPRVLVAAQPTQGLDVGAMEQVWDRLRSAAARGTAVLLLSTDLDEILALAHRIAVISRGRIVGEMRRDAVDLDRLGLLMGGAA